MSTPNLTNWICDIYDRIDAEIQIPLARRRQYRDEIHWAYRLGYMSRDEYYWSLEYLDTTADWKNAEAERMHGVRMAQIKYEQGLMASKAAEQAAIKELFRENVRLDRNKGLYCYKDR